MNKRLKDSHYGRFDRPVLALIGLILLVITFLPAFSDRKAEWRGYQKQFRDLVAQKYGTERATRVPRGIQQIWLGDLQRADRCMTCHQAILWSGFERAPQPFRSHPRGLLEKHPIEQFGCTPCHGGQGYAVDITGAHGETHFWDEPRLGSRLSNEYKLVGVNRNALIQINCNSCHRYDKETAGADAINLAKKTFKDQPCTDCHLVNGKGGTIGPDLTYVGGKDPEEFDFSNVKGRKTAFAWHIAHFKNAPAVVPATAMPDLGLTDEQAQSLAMLMLSWRKTNIPSQYRPEFYRAAKAPR